MINKIIALFSDLSLSKKQGRYLSDKAYAFDTIFFIAKFINYNMQNRVFNRQILRPKAKQYIEDIFQLDPDTAGNENYFVEATNLLEFGNIISKKDKRGAYFVNEPDVLMYIADRPENAYIFIYLLAVQTMKNDLIWDDCVKYCKTDNIEKKKDILQIIHAKFLEKLVGIINEGQFSLQIVKYTMNVLGFINNQNAVTRTLNVTRNLLTIKDMSLNVAGTRTPLIRPKKNDYLQTFNEWYVAKTLKKETITPKKVFPVVSVDPNIVPAASLADLKLAILGKNIDGHVMTVLEQAQQITAVVKSRNPVIQQKFRGDLFNNNAHVCPICGFSYEKHLQASHIRPVRFCDDTYDAVNHFNGFLMCPNHDKLFECAVEAADMTVDYKTGKIILSDQAKISPDYAGLDGEYIARAYIENERKHYLEWHNNKFLEDHQSS